MPERRIVVEDGEFLHYITRGYTSAYAIRAAMKKEAEMNKGQRIIAYSNIAERLLGLAKVGLIEETKIDDKPNIHFRKDYKLSSEGMIQLVSWLMSHAKEFVAEPNIKILTEYIDKYDFDKIAVGNLLFNYYMYITIFVREYLKYIELSSNVVPPGFEKNVMRDMVKMIVNAEKKSYPKPKLTTISVEDTIKISDSVTAKAAHALRVSVPTTRKKS